VNPIKVADAMTPEWYAARSNCIGASEIAAAAGLSPYQTPLELYHRKRGEIAPIEDNDAMRMGRLLEPVVKSEFVRETGLVFADPNPPMFRHSKHEPITATPDAIIDESTLFEAKTASWRMKSSWGDQDTDDVPPHYLCQCQQQMAVLNAAVVHLAVLFDGAQLKTFKVLRNDELINLLIAAGLELWERIKDGRPPEPTWTHASTPKLIKEIHGTINDTRVELNGEEVSAWADYESLGEIEKNAKERRELLKARVLHGIGDHFAGLLPDGRMIRRKVIAGSSYTVDRKSFIDVRAVKSDSGPIVDRTQSSDIASV
jgi:putative phage-type endonuclease